MEEYVVINISRIQDPVVLKVLMSHSTPLLPELDKAYEAGKLDKELSMSFDNPKARYLSNYTPDV